MGPGWTDNAPAFLGQETRLFTWLQKVAETATPSCFFLFAVNSPHCFRNATISPKCFAEVKHRQLNVGRSLDGKYVSGKPLLLSLLP